MDADGRLGRRNDDERGDLGRIAEAARDSPHHGDSSAARRRGSQYHSGMARPRRSRHNECLPPKSICVVADHLPSLVSRAQLAYQTLHRSPPEAHKALQYRQLQTQHRARSRSVTTATTAAVVVFGLDILTNRATNSSLIVLTSQS